MATIRTQPQSPLASTDALTVLSDSGSTYLLEMPWEHWAACKNHPRQRDTVRHAKKPHWQAAKAATGVAAEPLRHVVGAEFQDELYKVDGHTRAYLWEQGELPKPHSVIVTVHRATTFSDLMALYSAFDTAGAAETQNDRIFGAMGQAGLHLKSKRLRDGFIVDALNIALRGCTRKDQDKRAMPELDLYSAVDAYSDELRLLDSVDPQPEIFYGGIVAAALIALAQDPTAIAFFQRLSNRDGNMKDGRPDPVQAVLDLVIAMKHQRSAWVNSMQVDLCARTLRALDTWHLGPGDEAYWLKQKVRAVGFIPQIERVKRLKGISKNINL
jgi:hypothetical protein